MALTLAINSIDGDNDIDAANAASGITINGTVADSVLADVVGQTVSVTLNGATYAGVVQSNGTWSVTVGASALSSLTNGAAYTVGASVTDSTGKKATSSDKVTVDESATLAIKAIDGNGYINGTNAGAAGGITISGTSTGGLGTGDFAGETVTVTLNGASYTGTIGANGNWSVTVSKANLVLLTDGQSYTVTASATDKAGNATSTTSTVTVDKTATLAINPIDGNNYINGANAAAGITISGSVTDSILADVVGQTVSVTLNGATYTGVVQNNGTWSVNVGATALAGLSDGKAYAVSASVTDTAGNKASGNGKATVDESATLAIKAIDGNGYINGTNAGAAGGITISGTSTGSTGNGDFAGQAVTVALNGKTYTATVAANGAWSVTVSEADVALLTDGQSYTVSASAIDKAGNAATTTGTVTVDKTATLAINPIDGNNYVDAANAAAAGITLSGSVADSILADVVGQTVTVALNGAAYTAVVQSNGTWSVNVGATGLAGLTNGRTYTVSASVTDMAGNRASSTDRLTVDESATLAIKAIDGNGYINAKNAAAAGGITIAGTSSGGTGNGDFAGQTVALALNGKTYTATVAANGSWSVSVSEADVAQLSDGQAYTVTVTGTDQAGNPASASASVTVDKVTSLAINVIDGDGAINAAEAASGITITGTTGDSVPGSVTGRPVSVTLGGQTYTGTVQADGTWSVDVGAAALAALTDGKSYTVSASVTDAAGNRATSSQSVKLDEATLTISPIDGNGYVNATQGTSGVTISGTSTGGAGAGAFAGRTVSVTLNGKTYVATIAANGTWSVNVSHSDVAQLGDGQTYTVTASATDRIGTSALTSATLTVDESAGISIAPVAGNGFIDGANAAGGVTIGGTTSDSVLSSVVGQIVSVTLNGKSYTGTVASNGSWSVVVDAADLAALTDGQIYALQASMTDAAGNAASSVGTIEVDEHTGLAINAIDGNGFINGANAASGITISGAASDSILASVVGQTVSVMLNGKAYTGTVTANGGWSVVVGAADLAALIDGQSYLVTVSITDAAGNTADSEASVDVDERAQLAININPINGNEFINAANVASGITISGTATDSLLSSIVGQTVMLTLAGKTYGAVVQSDGTWSVNVGAGDLAALTDGQTYLVQASVTDQAANTASASTSVLVDERVSLTINPIDGNGFINAANAATGFTISGTATDSAFESLVGQTVGVTLNGQTYVAVVQGNGTWSLDVSSTDAAALSDAQNYALQASVTDTAGNVANASSSALVDRSASLTINPIDENGFISAADAAAGITITGTVTDSVLASVVGRTVSVTFDGMTYTGAVQSDGTWSVSIGAAALSALTIGSSYTVNASLTDSAGNTGSSSENVTVGGPLSIAGRGSIVVEQGVSSPVPGLLLTESGVQPGETLTVNISDSTGLLSASGNGVSGSGTTNLTVAGTLDEVNADLATLMDLESSGGGDTINVNAADNLNNTSAPATISVVVNGMLGITAPSSASVVQSTTSAVPGISIFETGDTAGETFTVDLGDANGLLNYTGSGIAGLGETNLTISGSLTQVNGDLATLTDTDAQTGSDPITISASDSLGGAANVPAIAVVSVAGSTPELVVSTVGPPASAIAGQQAQVSWTITNNGNATANGPWQDNVYLSSNVTGSPEVLLGTFQYDGALAPGQTLTRTETVSVPSSVSGSQWFVVQTDVNNQVGPPPNNTNEEAVAATPTAVVTNPQASLAVSSVTPPTSALSGQQTEVSWIVTNNGTGPTSSNYWTDDVYLSLSRTLNTSDLLLASVSNASYLAPGQSYANSALVTLPQGIAGPYYIIVQTDVGGQIGPHGGNEIVTSEYTASAPFPVTLSPTPDLGVTSIVAPSEDFSGQPLTVTWTSTNAGAATTDVGEWSDEILLSQDGQLDSSAIPLATVTHEGALSAGQSYTNSATVNLPVGFSGNFSLYVVADSAGQVYELGGSAAHAADTPLQVLLTPPPDLQAMIVDAPSGTVTAQSIAVSYQVTNTGSSETPNTVWSDTIYISPTPSLGSSAIALGTITHLGALAVGESYTISDNLALPSDLSGGYYLIVQADSGDQVFQLSRSNNVAVSSPINLDFNPVDLSVSNVTTASTATAGHQVIVSWQVANNGSGSTARYGWNDEVVLSASGVLGADDNLVLADPSNPQPLSGGASYTQSAVIDLPNDLSGTYTLFVVADAGHTIAEPGASSAVSSGQSLTVVPLAQLATTLVTGPTTDAAGDTVNVAWTVTNTSSSATDSDSWQDSVYLSTTPDLSGGHTYLGEVPHTGVLGAGSSYSSSGSLTLPSTLATGQYYFVVQPDSQGQVLQAAGASTTGGSPADSVTQLPSQSGAPAPTRPSPPAPPSVTLAPPSDLAVSAVTASAEVQSGQQLTVSWTLSDTDSPTSGNWSDEVYLSQNEAFDPSTAIALGSLQHTGSLASGESQTFTDSLTVPDGLSGPFYVFVEADATGQLNDPNRGNNVAISSVIQVDPAPQGDLSVGPVSIAAAANDDVSVTYTVDNLSDVATSNSWLDAVYLSSTGVWNVNDPILGYVENTAGVAADGSYTETLTTALPGVIPGNYYAIVRPDIRGTEPDSGTGNSTGVSTNTVAASLPQLTLGAASSGTLKAGGVAYYELTVGAGGTVDLSLTTDTPGSANDIYISYGAVPTIGQFDATASTPFAQNPDAVIQDTQAGTYYVLVRDSAGNPENYSLIANTVGYSITGITPNQGSNAGTVTITINGAQFNAASQVELIGPGGAVESAQTVQWVNSGTLWATFDLQGLSVGSYGVEVQQGSQSSTLPNSFTVTDGPAGQLAVSLTAPSVLHTHSSPDGLSGTQSGVVTITYTNVGGTDVAAPVFDLGATHAEFAGDSTGLLNPSQIAILGTSQSGPAGVIVPGGQETVAYTFTGNFGFAQFVTMELSLATVAGGNATIDWGSVESSLKPPSIDSTDWNLIWQRLETQVGTTTGSLLASLSQAATTLSQVGEAASSLNTLLAYELAQASGVLPNTTVAATTDVADSGAGIDLSLIRTYSSNLLNRNNPEAFGDGWTFTYGAAATTDASGNVYITSSSGTELFTLQSNGSYAAQPGDTATLTVSNGDYLLTEAGGTVERFSPEGRYVEPLVATVGSTVVETSPEEELSYISDANGDTVNISYNASGVISGVTSSNGQSLTFTSNAQGRITSVADGEGRVTTYTYSANGDQLLSASGPDGVTTYSYDSSGNPFTQNALTQITNANGTTSSFQYDNEGDLSAESVSGTGQISYSHPSIGTVVETNASGDSTTLTYDPNGNLVLAENAAGSATRLQYNSSNELSGITLPDGNTYTFSYDSSGNVTSYTDPQGGTVSATYEPGTTLVASVTDADGNTTHYAYNSAGDLTGITDASGGTTLYQYSQSGALSETIDANGETIQYTYNSQGLVSGEYFDDGTSQLYAYNSVGELVSTQARNGGVTTYTYNAAGELTSVTGPQNQVESYGYNSAGQEIQRVEPDGSVTNYDYNAAGQLAEIQDGNGNLIESYGYDADGRLVQTNMGNGASTSYSYDSLGNAAQILTRAANGSVTSDLTYTYDAESRPTTATSLDGTWAYTYNAAGEVAQAVFDSTNASIPSQNLSYEYDAAGNRTQTIFNGAVTNYSTNDLNQYTSANGTSYDYDADGNLVSVSQGGQTTTYTYDALHQLTATTGPTGTTTYQYDALGNLVSSTANGVESTYVTDPLALRTSANAALSAVAQVYDAAGAVTATYEYGEGPAAVIDSDGEQYFNTDAMGNVVSLSGAGGELTASYQYAPFGGMLSSTGSGGSDLQYAGGFGGLTDSSGLLGTTSGVYDPSQGRYITSTTMPTVNDAQIGSGSGYSVSSLGGTLLDLSEYGNDVLKEWADEVLQLPESYFEDVLGYAQEAGEAIAETPYPIVYGATQIAVDYNPQTIYSFQLSSLDQMERFANQQAANAPRIQDVDLPSFPLVAWLMGVLYGDSSGTNLTVTPVQSIDPNDIIGPAGAGPQQFISKSGTDAYTINFENSPTATAPAQEITITQQLDPNLNWQTFRLTGFGLGSQTTTLSGNQAFYSGSLNLQATDGCDVQVTAGVNVATGVVTWNFQAIDPSTGQAPLNPEIGLLPPDDAEGHGEGFVSYTVQPNASVQTGDAISAEATVTFDTNAPIATPTVTNTIDAVAPASAVGPLPAQTNDPDFEVSWSGTDDPTGSGVANYTIYASEDGGPWTVWLANTTRTNAIFMGTLGHTYAFSSVATDNAGNVESFSASAEASIVVGRLPAPAAAVVNEPSTINLGEARVGGTLSTSLSIGNGTSAPANGLDAAIGATSGDAVASGSISELIPGADDASDITVGLRTALAGPQAGSVAIDFASDSGTTVSALPPQTIDLTGTVYQEASPLMQVVPEGLIVHVGDAAPTLTIGNVAASEGYSENLIATIAATTGNVITAGSSGEIAAGASNSSISLLSTASAAVVSGTVTVDFQTDGTGIDGFGPTDLGQRTVSVRATVDNYANAALAEVSGPGTLTHSSQTYTLNLGVITQGSGPVSVVLEALNSASGPADLLGGTFQVSGSSAFSNNGFNSFASLGAGEADTSPTVTLNTANAGTFSESVTLMPVGSNASGYSGALPDETLIIEGTVAPGTPTITVGSNNSDSGAVTSNLAAGTLTTSGSLSYFDPISEDTPVVTVTPASGDLGSLTETVSPSSTGNGTEGVITWDYQVSESAVTALATGASDIDTFTITLTDSQGQYAIQTVTVAAINPGDSYSAVWSNPSGGNWSTASNWASGRPPGSTDTVLVNLPAGTNVAYQSGSTTVGGVTLQGAGSLTLSGGTLDVTGQLIVAGGALQLNGGTLEGATITNGGGSVNFDGGTLSGVTYDGALNLSSNTSVTVTNGLTLTGLSGSGPGTLNVAGGTMYLAGNQTLDNATVNLSTSGFEGALDADDTGAGSVLTLGKNLTVNFTGGGGLLNGGGSANDGIVNEGTLDVSGGSSSIGSHSFTNEGAIQVSGGASLSINSTAQVNAAGGTITVQGSGSRLSFGENGQSWTNAGTLSVGAGSTLLLYGNDTTAQLQGIQDAGTIDFEGTLSNSGTTLQVGPGTGIPSLVLEGGSSIVGGTIVDEGSGMSFSGGTLNGVTYDGALNLSSNTSVTVTNGLTLTGLSGSGPGTLNVAGGTMYLAGNQTLDNATVNLSTSGFEGALDADDTGAGSVLTLGKNLTVNFTGGGGLLNGGGSANDGIVNEGTLDVSGGSSSIGSHSFTNEGAIQVSGGASLTINATNYTDSGTLAVNGGTINVSTAATGGGAAAIFGTSEIEYGEASNENVTFANGSTGELVLADSAAYTGEISGFTGTGTPSSSDKLDLQDINFSSTKFGATYANNVLSVTDGTHTAHIDLVGSYALASFEFQSDGKGGTLVFDPPAATPSSAGCSVDAQASLLSQYMAATFTDALEGAAGGLHYMSANQQPEVILAHAG